MKIYIALLIIIFSVGCTSTKEPKPMLKKELKKAEFKEKVEVKVIPKAQYYRLVANIKLDVLAKKIAKSMGISITRDEEPIEDILSVTLYKKFVKISMKAGFIFTDNSDELTMESKEVLYMLSNELKKYPDLIIKVAGHTDNKGSYAYNYRLSEKRALNVMRELKSSKLQNSFFTTGCSYKKALYRVGDEYTLSLNRRVEIYLYRDLDDMSDICK